MFNSLKIAITSVSILAFSNTSILFYIYANSLNFAIKVVLSQISINDGKQYLVMYFSKSLFLVKYNYKIYNKKMLAII